MRKGEIKEGRGGFYTVRDEAGSEHILRAKKKFRRDGLSPLPGDRVLFTPRKGEEHGWIEEILPRRSLCIRPPVANISLMVIVIAHEPVPDFLLVDKLLVYADMQGIRPVIAVNKCDLDMAVFDTTMKVYQSAGIKILAVSAYTGMGLEDLCHEMQGELTGFAGQSGVGKSALLSCVTGMDLVSGAISDKIRRGKQTTRHTTLIYHEGMKLMDTPGFSLFELPKDLSPEQLSQHYPDFRPYEEGCRFSPCLHLTEPGCMVKQAVQTGRIDLMRMARYTELMDIVKKKWRERYD